MTIQRSLLLILLALTCFTALAQRTLPKERTAGQQLYYSDLKGHALGVILSSASGKGMAYRYWPRDLGMHVAFFPAQTTSNSYLSLGMGAYYKVFSEDNKRLFLHLGTEFISQREERFGVLLEPLADAKTQKFNVAFGPGLEIMSNRFIIDFMLGYGLYNTTSDVEEDSSLLNLSGGIAMYFAF